MMTNAMVFAGPGKPLVEQRLQLAAVTGSRVLVEIRASGVCHSDLHIVAGEWDAEGGMVLGHEGAGIVLEVGPDVTAVEPGDNVILNWFAP